MNYFFVHSLVLLLGIVMGYLGGAALRGSNERRQ
jgi:hypothetical protein